MPVYLSNAGSLGQESAVTPQAASPWFSRLSDAVRAGQWTVALGLAMLGGERNINKLTDVLFFARYPASRSRNLTRAEQKAWIHIRDRIVKPALKLLATSTPTPGVTKAITTTDPIVKNIARHAAVINRVSQELGFDANIVRGIIAAESGGRESLRASSGYTGLMQAGKEPAHLNPETSIRAGIANYKEKAALLSHLLRPFNIDLQKLDRDTRVRLTMAAYNAGQRTAAKAMGFAHAAGSSADWMKPEHFQRALFQTGAYSVRNSSCLRVTDPAAFTAALAVRYGLKPAAVQGKYLLQSGWNTAGLLNCERELLAKRATTSNLTLPQVQAIASAGLVCAVALKHKHLPGYTEKVIRYMHFFDGQTSP